MMRLIEALEDLILDPRKQDEPDHCIEEYNAGVRNAIWTVKDILDAEG